ncbi:putative secreted protein [Firmicutes bacterium CAG:227]|nr:putative secreted protein [Firmicutes bacterium CAG:227]
MATLEISKNKGLYFVIPEECGTGVKKVAGKVAKDVEGTLSFCPEICETAVPAKQAVIAVTAGSGKLAETLCSKISKLGQVEGKRESYAFIVAENPVEGIESALVIYGSDKLGTIYGLFHLSELLGVTAMVDWGDCQYVKQDSFILKEEDSFVSKEPSVKYRGFFINDEWPCCGNWATSHFGSFNAKMYDHIFEYLLRMKGNYLWPAMWAENFMLDGPDLESMKLADEYGIYIGMSHHEPCMRSGAEYSKVRGPKSPYGDAWSYVTNKEGILRFWEDGVKRSIGHNVFPTVGMRGENDSKMLGEDSLISDNVRLLKEIITKQREMIHEHLETDGKKVPQLFAVYKEVEDYYFGGGSEEGLRGFKELEDVTLLLCEDNWGNMRALPEAFERNHKGGFGMYFHLDYHGDPVSYEWVSSTELSKIWEQMTEAYEYGVRELWIVNVGDVKFQEFPLNYFMDLAYDFEKWGSLAPNSTKEYTKAWIESVFGSYTSKKEREEIQEVLEGYLKINALRKPESLNDTVYHPAHYLECEKLLSFCGKLEEKNERLWKILEERGMGDAYFSMIYFSAEASFNLLKMHLYSGKNHLYASQGKAVANEYDKLVEACIEKDEALKTQMAEFKDGKWAGMELASHIGFTNWNDEDWRYPVRHIVRLPKKPRLVVTRADKTQHYTNQYFPITLVIDDFVVSSSKKAKIQIANGGQGSVKWKIQEGARKVGLDGIAHESGEGSRCEWLEFSQISGETTLQDEVEISLKEENLPLGEEVSCSFEIKTETEFVPVLVKALKKDTSALPEGAFLAEHGMFVIDAVHYADKQAGLYEGEAVEFKELYDFGKYQSGIKAFPVTSSFDSKENAPSVTYELYSEEEKDCFLNLYTSPANPLIYGGKLSVEVSVNEGAGKLVEFTKAGYKGGEPGCIPWEQAVLNQEHVGSTEISLKKGLNKITVFAREAGMVLERLVVYPKDMERAVSYLGEKECIRVTPAEK